MPNLLYSAPSGEFDRVESNCGLHVDEGNLLQIAFPDSLEEICIKTADMDEVVMIGSYRTDARVAPTRHNPTRIVSGCRGLIHWRCAAGFSP